MKFTKSETKWVKFGKLNKMVFVGKEVITYGQGCYMVFITMETGKSEIYAANIPEKGVGIRCYVGHRIIPIFAFAESDCNPHIYVHNYPEFNQICKLGGESFMGYTSLLFADASVLYSLEDIPTCTLTAWNWRTGEKLATIDSDIQVNCQLLKLTLFDLLKFSDPAVHHHRLYVLHRPGLEKPQCLIQLGVGTTRINIYNLLKCGTKCVINELKVIPRPDMTVFSAVLWSSEGSTFILDVLGNVFMVNQDMEPEIIIESSEEKEGVTSFTWLKGGLFIAGPSRKVQYYRKNGTWNLVWSGQPPDVIENITSNNRDYVVMTTVSGNILQLVLDTWEFKYVNIHESQFIAFSLVYPTGKYIATLTLNNELSSWDLKTGAMKNIVQLKNKALALASNPEYPYVGVGYSNGVLELFSLYAPEKIASMVTFWLTRNAINSVYFTEISKLIVAADTLNGQFFIIEGVPGSQMNVVGTVDFKRQIADYILVASKTCYRLFTLPVTSDSFLCGNKFYRHCVIKGNEQAELKEFQLNDPKQMYTTLYATTKWNRDRVFYAIPFRSKVIHVIETRRGDSKARVIQKINTGHQINKFYLTLHTNKMLSYGYDGLLMIRDPNSHEPVNVIMPHHRSNGGIIYAHVTPNKKYVLTLGMDNNLVCTALSYVAVDEKKEDELEKQTLQRLERMFSNKTIGFEVTAHTDKTWLELVVLRTTEREHKSCIRERYHILEEFKVIQKEVQELLTKNIEGPENEILDVQKFNLDTEQAEDKRVWSEARCRHAKTYLETLIVAQDNVTKWCKNYFWKRMHVQGKAIWAICDNFEIRNCVMFPQDDDNEEINAIAEKRRMEDLMARLDSFRPWMPYTESELAAKLAQAPQLAKPDEGPTLQLNLEDEDEEKEKEINIDEIIAKNGSLACNFVELNPWHYTQEERHTFYQRSMEAVLCLDENNKLKTYFNNKFDVLHAMKVREVHNIKERYARLRHIISEINFFSVFKIHIDIVEPEWQQVEIPEMIITVQDKEVGIEPYISPSTQARLDAKAAEDERIRLLLLADDFRERALMAMMNGVLEVRWEDELKKDVPVPKCMMEKQPEDYIEEDLRAVREYEEKVKFLQSEREKYINMLYVEYNKLSNITREGMRKFNSRLADALVLKLEVETGVAQQRLQVHRIRQSNHEKNLMAAELFRLDEDYRKNEAKVEIIQKKASQIYLCLHELRNNLEQLLNKDKQLEKAFKKEYSEQSTIIQETLYKIYKRRPKTTIKNINDPAILTELINCLLSHQRTSLLSINKDTVEFFKGMDGLDAYIGVPSIIDERMFNNVCKHRRLKVENEIQIRAATLEIIDGEQSLVKVKTRIAMRKAQSSKILDSIARIRQNKLKMEENIEVQISIRRAFVEIPTSGHLTDFDDAILICRNVVEDINKILVKKGSRKLAAMRETMAYRRKILLMEWEHQELRMKIEDIKQQLVDIENVKLTKEIRWFLQSRAKNQAGDIGLSFDQEVEIIKDSYERTIEEKKQKIKDLQKQIGAIRKENKKLDMQIEDINVDICEFKIIQDKDLSKTEEYILKERMAILIKRAKLVKQIQENHNEMLVKQTELELWRLKTYPTLKYKILT